MTTMLVLLCDKGIASGKRALGVYSQLHRLFLVVVNHYNLWGDVNSRLNVFLKQLANRTKSGILSLGNFLPLLSISMKHVWTTEIRQKLVNESFDCNVLWMCSKNADDMSSRFAMPPSEEDVDKVLLTKGLKRAPGC